MKIFGLEPSPADIDRIAKLATEALAVGAAGDERTWLDAVRKVQPRFDWSRHPRVTDSTPPPDTDATGIARQTVSALKPLFFASWQYVLLALAAAMALLGTAYVSFRAAFRVSSWRHDAGEHAMEGYEEAFGQLTQVWTARFPHFATAVSAVVKRLGEVQRGTQPS